MTRGAATNANADANAAAELGARREADDECGRCGSADEEADADVGEDAAVPGRLAVRPTIL